VTGVVALSVISLLTLALGVWSRRLKVRLQGTPAAGTHFGTKFGMLYIFLFPLAGVFALTAILMTVNSLVDGPQSETNVEDGCESVDLAVGWLSSDEPADQALGAAVATEVWERSMTDDVYSIDLRRRCAVQVLTMLDLAGLSYNP
jgi:hypothetical protein